ncbi:N-acetyl-gamma-glutamyl-phosphate reductase [Candidatus Sumerlaeota bacterium]|nr:N-acetyl-gamma-glutamyl-phosphate reductase [Candidatus Sumerlaeota bacterium]
MIKVGIIGAKAYTAGELIRILLRHPETEIAMLAARVEAPEDPAVYHPQLRGQCGVPIEPIDCDRIAEACDFVFLTMPHMAGAEYALEMTKRGVKVADLSADFRFRNLATYEKTYGIKHIAPELNDEAPYGLVEIYRDQLKGKRLVAVPGCYVTSVLLPLAPIIAADWIDRASIISDSKSGVSGAGRTPSDTTHFCEADESMMAYKVATHRHQPEIEETLSDLAGESVQILFVPHLAPMYRGILSTIYLQLTRPMTLPEIYTVYQQRYGDEPFIRLLPPGQSPRTKDVAMTNFCDIGLMLDPRTNRLIVVSALDNLIKGASGQAVQVMNAMLGIEETAGLL